MPTPAMPTGQAAGPAGRDRFADLLRVASIVVVVAGHWLVAVVGWRDGRVEGGNALALVPGLWLATWGLQVMPLFFFVGGLANLVSARRGGGWVGFVRGRAARLLRPTAALLAVWTVAAVALHRAGVPEAVLRPATRLVVQPLWFLGLYLVVVALAPAMLALHRRFGPAVAVGLGLGAGVVDLAGRLPGLERLGELNFALVWLFAHQLGFLCIVALTVWLVGLAMLVRGPVDRWLRRSRPWALVVAAGSTLMTLFLWHLTALVLAVLVLHPAGLADATPGSLSWWALRPLWILVPAAMLIPLVAAFARLERPHSARPRAGWAAPASPAGVRGGRWRVLLAGGGTVAVVVGLLGVAVAGVWPLDGPGGDLVGLPVGPGQGLLWLAAGMAALAVADRPGA